MLVRSCSSVILLIYVKYKMRAIVSLHTMLTNSNVKIQSNLSDRRPTRQRQL